LATVSYLLNYTVLDNRNRPGGYHAVNLALHAINILVLYLLLLELLPPPYAFAASLLWAVHPVLTESVTNIIGRTDLLAAFGVLAGLLAHRRAAREQGRNRPLWLGALFAAAAVGFFSKESAIVLLGVIAHDLAFDSGAWRRAVPGYAKAWAAATLFAIRAGVLAHVPFRFSPLPFTDNPLFAGDLWTARLSASA
jgi:hypothetical protein